MTYDFETPQFGPSASTSKVILHAVHILIPAQFITDGLWLYTRRKMYQYIFFAVSIVTILLGVVYLGAILIGWRQKAAWRRSRMDVKEGKGHDD